MWIDPQPTRVQACLQSYQDRVVMGSTAEHQAEGRIVIIIIYGMNAIELLLAHKTHAHTSIVLVVIVT